MVVVMVVGVCVRVCVSDRGAVTSACLTHCRRLIRADRSRDGDGMGGKDAWLAALAATGVPPRKLAISERVSERDRQAGWPCRVRRGGVALEAVWTGVWFRFVSWGHAAGCHCQRPAAGEAGRQASEEAMFLYQSGR